MPLVIWWMSLEGGCHSSLVGAIKVVALNDLVDTLCSDVSRFQLKSK